MERWYVLKTAEKKEQAAAELLERAVDHACWSECRVLRKIKVFRTGGVFRLLDDVLFPGYLLVKTDCPGRLAKELLKSRELPQLANAEALEKTALFHSSQDIHSDIDGDQIAAIEAEDLEFLQNICGENLQRAMGVTRISLDENNRIIEADGVLKPYLDRIVKLNLHKRFAIVEIPLFHRMQPILFGLRLPQDQAG